MAFSTLPAKATIQATPFQIKIPDTKLTQLKQLIELSPIAEKTYESNLTDRSLGLNHEWFSEAVKIWKTDFDW